MPRHHIRTFSLELLIMKFLWAFEFLPALDKNGQEIVPDLNNIATGITATPLPFRCRIKPRSLAHADMIEKQFARSAEFLQPFELELTDEEKRFNREYRDKEF